MNSRATPGLYDYCGEGVAGYREAVVARFGVMKRRDSFAVVLVRLIERGLTGGKVFLARMVVGNGCV